MLAWRASSPRWELYMKRPTAIVTDSTADIPPRLARELGISVVPSRFAFASEAMVDGDLEGAAFYRRLENEPQAPQIFGVPEAAFRSAFAACLDEADSVLCLVTPFDVSASFTTASAAMLSMERADIKILNPGVASAGLCSLLRALAPLALAGASRSDVIAALDEFEPQCDTLFVPADPRWLERAGRLPLIEDRIGVVGDRCLVVRVGTRVTGVVLAESPDAAREAAIGAIGRRLQTDAKGIVTVAHANAPDVAAAVAERVQQRWPVADALVTELSATIGAQLGPGAIGIGIAPASAGGTHA